MTSVGSKSVVFLSVAAALTVALCGGTAAAHFKVHGDWVYAGHTHTDNPRIDPLTVLFQGSGREAVGQDMVPTAWPIMFELNFNVFDSCGGTQNIYDRHPQHDDQVDHQLVSACYASKYHMRIWDSVEHDNAYPIEHGATNRNQFNIAGVHRDKCCPDHVHKRWEATEHFFAHKMNSYYCTYRNDLHLPGSGGEFQKFYSNGKVTRVSPEPRQGHGPCNGA